MSAPEKLYTERELVLRERAAAARVRCHDRLLGMGGDHRSFDDADGPCRRCQAWAADLFPLPKVEKPRVVTIPSEREGLEDHVIHLRVVDRRVQYWYEHKESTGAPFSPDGHDLLRSVQRGDSITDDFANILLALARENLLERPTEPAEDDSHV